MVVFPFKTKCSIVCSNLSPTTVIHIDPMQLLTESPKLIKEGYLGTFHEIKKGYEYGLRILVKQGVGKIQCQRFIWKGVVVGGGRCRII